MKNYISPEIDILYVGVYDVITASFGNLEDLPSGDDTPVKDLGGGRFDW